MTFIEGDVVEFSTDRRATVVNGNIDGLVRIRLDDGYEHDFRPEALTMVEAKQPRPAEPVLEIAPATEPAPAEPTLCFRCGDVMLQRYADDPNILECGGPECHARLAHGEPMPRVVVQKYNEHFVAVTFQHEDGTEHQKYLDNRLAKLLATALDSIT